jgi:hypothetical protein
MSILPYYYRAAALLAQPRAWTTGAWARDASGNVVTPKSSDAVSWDMDGAIKKVCPDSATAYELIQYNNYIIRSTTAVTLNDREHFDQYRAVARLLATMHICDTRASYRHADKLFAAITAPSDLE